MVDLPVLIVDIARTMCSRAGEWCGDHDCLRCRDFVPHSVDHTDRIDKLTHERDAALARVKTLEEALEYLTGEVYPYAVPLARSARIAMAMALAEAADERDRLSPTSGWVAQDNAEAKVREVCSAYRAAVKDEKESRQAAESGTEIERRLQKCSVIEKVGE